MHTGVPWNMSLLTEKAVNTFCLATQRDEVRDSWLAHGTLLAALVSWSVVLLPTTVLAQTDDFNASNDNSWAHYDPIAGAGLGAQNSWTFPAGAYRLQAAPTPNPALGPGRVASFRHDVLYTNFYAAVDLVDWNDTLTEAIAVIARVQPDPSLGTTDGYLFGYVAGAGHYVQIARLTDERTFSITGSAPVPLVLDPSKDYRFVFIGREAQLEGRVYELPNVTTPLVTVTAFESTYLTGTAGLLAFSLNNTVAEAVDVTFDNYYATDVEPPRLRVVDLNFGEYAIGWPVEAAAYTLQSTSALEGNWTDVNSSEIRLEGDQFLHYLPAPIAPAPTTFFRLIRR